MAKQLSKDSGDSQFETRLGKLFLILIVVLPILWVVLYSLLYSLGGIGRISSGWTADHWKISLFNGSLLRNLLYSFLVSAISVLISTVVSLSLTFAFHQSRNSRTLLALLCIPLGTPAAVNALIVYQILNPGGFVSRITWHLGLIESPSNFPPLVNDDLSVGIVIAVSLGAIPLLTLYFLKIWTTAAIDRYWRLAEQLGASAHQIRTQVILPMLLRRARGLLLLMFLIIPGSYEIPYLLGVQSPQMMSVAIQSRSGRFDLSQRPQAFVLATVYFGITGIGVYAFLKGHRRG